MTNKNRMKQIQLAFPEWLQGRVRHVEDVLDDLLPPADVVPVRLHEAMRYAVLGGGKRVRAALVYAAGQACPCLLYTSTTTAARRPANAPAASCRAPRRIT